VQSGQDFPLALRGLKEYLRGIEGEDVAASLPTRRAAPESRQPGTSESAYQQLSSVGCWFFNGLAFPGLRHTAHSWSGRDSRNTSSSTFRV
jgi:hypothetical protein